MFKILLLSLFISISSFQLQYAYSFADCSDQQISAQEIMDHIRYLASDDLEGRMSGTEGAEKAALYISSEFKKSGLVPLGDNNSYFQYFLFTKEIVLGSDNNLKIKTGDKTNGLKLGEDFNALSFSSTGEFEGDLVFAGYGISAPELEYDDYQGLDVKDKAVIVLRYTPEGYDAKSPFYNYAPLRYKAMNAREKGAKAIIFVTPFSQQEEEDLTTIGIDYSYSDSGIQSLILRREIAQDIINSSGNDLETLEEKLSKKQNASYVIENSQAKIKTELLEDESKTANVVGMIEGSDPVLKEEVIVIGAHYDHIGYGKRGSRSGSKNGDSIHNGADDNASGIAGLIELVNFYSCNKDLLKRSLVFIAFSAEELGLIGASYYIDNPKVPLDKTVAMINMDMVGRINENKLTVFGIGSTPGWKEILNKSNSEIGFELTLDKSGFAPSDQSVFFAKQIPVLHFFSGLHDDYHTPEDDWDKINSEGEKKVLLLITEVIKEINSEKEKLPFSNEEEPKKGLAKFNVYLGTIPDYSNQMEGVKLMGVKDGSPADKAGLKSEDTIIQFGGVEIKNIYDYVYALGASKPGVPTALVVLRDYKPLSLVVVPEKRDTSSEN